jgi:hypothetical protein
MSFPLGRGHEVRREMNCRNLGCDLFHAARGFDDKRAKWESALRLGLFRSRHSGFRVIVTGVEISNRRAVLIKQN